MSILIDASTTFIVQGITGREAVNLTRECLDYGSGAKVVGGVTPPTILAPWPYSRHSRVRLTASRPVMPWTMNVVVSSSRPSSTTARR